MKEGHIDVVRLLLGKWPREGGGVMIIRGRERLRLLRRGGVEEIVRLVLKKVVELAVPL